jgi:hypothetical protein
MSREFRSVWSARATAGWAFVAWLNFGCASDPAGGDGTGGPHDGLVPGDPVPLSPPNSASGGKDEDASILLATDGRFYVAWLSNRDGNDDLYVMRSDDGLAWSAPARVTTNLASDWYPTLLQDGGGRFHLTWMRQASTTRTVVYNSSADGLSWDPSSELAVTGGVSDDFVPHAIEHAGHIHVYFDSALRSSDGTRSLFLVQSTMRAADGSVTAWSAPVELTSANSSTESDQFAFVQRRAQSSDLLMVWLRHTASPDEFVGFLHPSADLYFATSADGVAWDTPAPVMAEDGAVDTMPAFYAVDLQERLLWMRGVSAAPHVFEMPLGGSFPGDAVDVTLSNALPGWSPRVTPTLKRDTYLRVWVSAADTSLYSQVFER